MNTFFDSFECRSGKHCKVCRDRIGGGGFRKNIATYFRLSAADWDCPHGRGWGIVQDIEPIPCSAPAAGARPALDDQLTTIRQICFACKVQGAGCRFGELSPCKQRKMLARFPKLHCRLKPPKW